MTERKDSLGRLFVDIVVTIVLVFSGIGVAGVASEWIAPRVGIVYTLCLWTALIPMMLWLRRCRVGEITRPQLAAIFVMSLVYSLVIDFLMPNPAAGPHWVLATIMFGMMRLLEWLFERVPMLRRPVNEQAEQVEE